MLDTIDNTIGLKRLRCLHFNDSKGAVASHLDRHEHIGKGEIGIEGFRALLADKRVWKLPAILETPKEFPDSDVENLWRTIELAIAAGAVKKSEVGEKPDGRGNAFGCAEREEGCAEEICDGEGREEEMIPKVRNVQAGRLRYGSSLSILSF